MAHVFRFNHSDSETIDGWGRTSRYGSTAIKAIADPNGSKADLPITSIPSPFAGFELVRSAFAYCTANVTGQTIYHKMVSHALDLLEILYNYKKFQNKFDIIVWDKAADLANLKADGYPEHRLLAETLELFLNQDADAFNFGWMQEIYLLNYRQGPAPLNIVGGTSPTSLCMASVNDLSYVDVDLSTTHKAFDSNPNTFLALHERSAAFFKYVWLLSKQPQFGRIYPEVNAYIQAAYKASTDQQLKNEINALTPTDYGSYEPLRLGQKTLYFAGNIPIGMEVSMEINKTSDFRVSSTRWQGDLPLVLPNTAYSEPGMRYTTSEWDGHKAAPFYDPHPLTERALPFDGAIYPYLTVDDLLQPYLIQTIFPIDSQKFFTAGFEQEGYAYLLPLKPLIFDLFSAQELRSNVGDRHRKPMVSLREESNAVRVTLNIPVQQGKVVTFDRLYYKTESNPNVQHNEGRIVECHFDLFLYPAYHLEGTFSKPQRIYLTDEDSRAATRDYNYTVQAYKDGQPEPLPAVEVLRNDKRDTEWYSSKYYCLDEEYDFLTVSNGFAENIVLPTFRQLHNGSRAFRFAIDFGTTNTHIEYGEGKLTQPFDITAQDEQILSLNREGLHAADIDMPTVTGAEFQQFVPHRIGAPSPALFPMRTNLCTAEGLDASTRRKYALADYTIGFHYEKFVTYTGNRALTELKWAGNNEKLIEPFFEELLLLVRSKVLLNGGDLNKTEITWFYPVSMTDFQRRPLEDCWRDLCRQLISPSCQVKVVTESLAPYYYYKNEKGVTSVDRPVLSIDVGGGTSDFVIYDKNQPVALSSIRFAGNNLYGDFVGRGMSTNGFIARYQKKFAELLLGTGGDAEALERKFRDAGSSAEYVNFLFSLEKNAALQKDHDISFSDVLRHDDDMRLVLLFFFTSEIYYAAHLLKNKGLKTPAYLTVSGTASRMFPLIGSTTLLQGLAKVVFNDILGDDGDVELKEEKNPKEITCKGGLCMTQDDVVNDVRSIETLFTGSPRLDAVEGGLKFGMIDDDVKADVLQSYRDYISYFFSLNSKYSFSNYFGITNQKDFEHYREVLTRKASEDLGSVIDARRKEASGEQDPALDDSLFAFPLWGGINRLAECIATC